MEGKTVLVTAKGDRGRSRIAARTALLQGAER